MKRFSLRNAMILIAFGINFFVAVISFLMLYPIEMRQVSSIDGRWLESQTGILKFYSATGSYYWFIPFLLLAICLIWRRKAFPTVISIAMIWPFFWLAFLTAVFFLNFVTMSGLFFNP